MASYAFFSAILGALPEALSCPVRGVLASTPVWQRGAPSRLPSLLSLRLVVRACMRVRMSALLAWTCDRRITC